MVVRRRLFIMISVMVLASLLMLLLFWLLLQKNVSSIMESKNDEDHQTMVRIIELEGRSVKGFVYDWTYWDDMVDFVNSGDEEWQKENLDEGLITFECDACWVFKPDMSQVAFRRADGVEVENVTVDELRSAFSRDKFPHWFGRSGEDIIEYRGAPVQPTSDVERKTEPRGYFVVGRLWGAERVDQIRDVLGVTSVRLTEKTEDSRDPDHAGPGCKTHNFDLPSAGGNGSYTLVAEMCSPAVNNLIRINGFAAVAISLMLLLTLGLFVVGLTLWVSAPISMLARALEQKEPSIVEPLLSQKSEMGYLAQLLKSFFYQQDELKREIGHRKEIQARQERLHGILRIWGTCNFAMATCRAERDLLDRICKTLVNLGGYQVAWFGEAKWSGQAASVKVVNSFGDDKGYLDLMREALSGNVLEMNCVVGQSLKTKDAAVCRGLEGKGQANCEDWETEAVKRGIRSACSFPLMQQGEAFGVLVLLSREPADFDVDERKVLSDVVENLSSGIQLLRSEMARKEAERKAEELSEQLIRTQKLEAVGRLAGGIAHDFNNLLFVIMGNLELIMAEGLDDSVKPEFNEAMEACKQATSLTKQLLSLGRRKVTVAEPVNINSEIERAYDLIKSTVKENVSVHLQLDSKAGIILGDPVQIRQVFMNLSVNARDAMPGGGVFRIITENVCVDPDFAPEAAPGDYVLATVSDTGVGMDEEVLAHAFEPFFTTKEEGTGLGLALVNSIVSQHGGFIRASSVRGAGTTFRIFLPIADVLPGREKDTAAVELMKAKAGETVLLVEDRDMCRLLSKTMLETLGYSVIEAGDADAAIKKIEGHKARLDVILSDVVLPGFSGPEMVEKLREMGVKSKVVYMSGYADRVLAHHGLTGTKVPLLQKPFNLSHLARHMRDAISMD